MEVIHRIFCENVNDCNQIHCETIVKYPVVKFNSNFNFNIFNVFNESNESNKKLSENIIFNVNDCKFNDWNQRKENSSHNFNLSPWICNDVKCIHRDNN
jgi:hypothetical protein